MHIIYGHKHDLTMDDVPPIISSEPLLSRTTTINASPAPNTNDERDQSTSTDEITPLITRPEGNVDSGKLSNFNKFSFIQLFFFLVAQNLISCCSLINNYHILKCNSYPKTLACLNGIRVLSLCWIILGHTLIFAIYYSGKDRLKNK